MALIAYTENRPRCKLCRRPSFGAFTATFAANGKPASEELVILCAECGFTDAARYWNGAWSKKLKTIKLEAIFKLPPSVAPQPKKHHDLPEAVFVPSHYDATFNIDGDHFKGDLGVHPTPYSALERARQLSHLTAKQMHLRNYWCLEHGISRRPSQEGEPQ